MTATQRSRIVRNLRIVRNASCVVLSLLACLLALGSSLGAQQVDHSEATREAMAPLHWWVGEWTGKGWVMTPDRQRIETDVVETVESRVDGQVLVFEGVGTEPESGTVGHHALGVVSWDAPTGEYRMRTFRSGAVLDPEVDVNDDGTLVWGFPQGPGRVRFTVRHTEDDRWVETGEFSPDGEQWFPMFGMDLSRVETPADR